MIQTIGFLIALTVGSLIAAITIGIGVQWAASEFSLGPIPRAFIGGATIIPSVLLVTIDLGIFRLTPLLLVIYYLGTFQIGTKIAHAVGMEAPDDNEPPEMVFDILNRYQ
jgi:hypothetical protein